MCRINIKPLANSYDLMPWNLEEKTEWFLNSGQELKALSELQQIQASLCFSLSAIHFFHYILVSVDDCQAKNDFSVHPICRRLIPGVCIKICPLYTSVIDKRQWERHYLIEHIVWPWCKNWVKTHARAVDENRKNALFHSVNPVSAKTKPALKSHIL